ncbi:Mobile element protein [hydrothermal vent metagenome]|uniref:Mobile element protein n=1 Tax=hydrothermal vent metagenome TaxID=652676 RepID=A0A3B0YKB3_9ZZZZ
MPKPRSAQVSLEATPYYHCTSRCVRRAFLCDFNADTNKDYEYHRQWQGPL